MQDTPCTDPYALLAAEHGVPVEEVRAHFARIDRKEAASALPAPGPALAALLGESPLEWCGHTLRPVTFTDWLCLQALDSPLFPLFRELARPEAERGELPEFSLAQLTELIFLWTHPSAQCRELLAHGAPAYRQAVAEWLDTAVRPDALGEMQGAMQLIGVQVGRAFAAKLSHGPAPGPDGNPPRPPAKQATASAGGSTPLAPSPAPSASTR